MKRRKIASLLITALTVSMLVSGCGNKQNDTEKNSEVVSGTETENVSEMETEETTESQVSSETQVATNDSSEKESEKEDEKESEKKDENKEENKPVEPTKPTHTCDYSALKSDSNNHWYACSCGKTTGKGAHNYDNNSDASCNTCGFTRTVHTCNYSTLKTDASNHWYVCSCGATSGKGAHNYDNDADATCNTCGFTREVKPVEPSVPSSSVNWNGGDIYLDNVGIKIPTLTEFNKTGISSTDNKWWWTGHEDDNQALSSMNRIYLTCEEFGKGLIAQGFDGGSSNGFSVSRNRIWWSWSGGTNEHFALSRHDGYYVLTINQSLKSHDFFGIDVAPWNKDIVKTLISFISGTPTKVYDYLFGCLYGDLNVYPIYTDRYVTVGDCKIKVDPYFTADPNPHFKFYIMPK